MSDLGAILLLVSYAGKQGAEILRKNALLIVIPESVEGLWQFPFLIFLSCSAQYLSIIYVGKVQTLKQVQGDVEMMYDDQVN